MTNQNIVIIAGPLSRNPELRFTPKGTAVCTFGLEITKEFESAGEKKRISTFVDCKAWGDEAQEISEHLRKGTGAIITGELSSESWEDKTTGKKRYKMIVTARSFAVATNSGETKADATPELPAVTPIKTTPVGPDDDVPF